METINNPPYAASLIESVRSLGYTFEAAISDLIDNAISAKASHIQIFITPDEHNPSIAIVDDGVGMNDYDLAESLRFGCKNPKDARKSDDLGRFGLGMKTASLSLCRRVIVASKQGDTLSCYALDLDEVERTNQWSIIKYSDEDEVDKLPNIDSLKSNQHGTYVLLQDFDRVEASSDNLLGTLNSNMVRAEEHIALVFHRIISEDHLKISINNRVVTPKDPFLSKHKATQALRGQSIDVDGETIKIQPYVLPHKSLISPAEMSLAGGAEDLRRNQGFYIYRCKRLIVWGTWFRLLGKQELNKLARVKVDIPNTLDKLWDIDVKKSSAKLPDKIRNQLYSVVSKSVLGSEYTIRNTGVPKSRGKVIPIWNRIVQEDGSVEYKINRDIPQLRLLVERYGEDILPLINTLLRNIESSLPAREVYLDIADGEVKEATFDELLKDFNDTLEASKVTNIEREDMLKILLKTEPYVNYDNLEEEWRKKYE